MRINKNFNPEFIGITNEKSIFLVKALVYMNTSDSFGGSPILILRADKTNKSLLVKTNTFGKEYKLNSFELTTRYEYDRMTNEDILERLTYKLNQAKEYVNREELRINWYNEHKFKSKNEKIEGVRDCKKAINLNNAIIKEIQSVITQLKTKGQSILL